MAPHRRLRSLATHLAPAAGSAAELQAQRAEALAKLHAIDAELAALNDQGGVGASGAAAATETAVVNAEGLPMTTKGREVYWCGEYVPEVALPPHPPRCAPHPTPPHPGRPQPHGRGGDSPAAPPQADARISIFDCALMYGDMVFEMTRSFNGKPYRLRDHLERLYGSLKYAEIDCGLTIDEMEAATLETIERNKDTLEGLDYQIMHDVTRGGSSRSFFYHPPPPPSTTRALLLLPSSPTTDGMGVPSI